MASPSLQEVKLASAKVDFQRKRLRLAAEEKAAAERAAEEQEAEAAASGGVEAGRYCRTLSSLSRRIGISRPTLYNLTKQADAPKKHGTKGYIVTEWGQWLLKRKSLSQVESAERTARVRYLEAQAEAREMANAERAGKMMAREVHEAEIREFAKAVADAVEAIRQRAAMRGVDAVVLKVVEETGAELRHEILKRCGGGGGGGTGNA